LRRIAERATGGDNQLEQLASSLEQTFRLSSFFQPYAAALEEFGYTGAVIIHVVEEVDVASMVSLLRDRLKIIES
jgi:hypothetical protein